MPTCETIREEFSALLDGELDAETREAVESHLHECSDCLRELGRYKKVTGMYERMERMPAPPGFEERVADAIRSKATYLPARRKFYVRWEMALAAAAVLLIIAGTFVILPTVHAPGTFQIGKSKEAPSAQPVVQTAPREAAPEQALYSEEKDVSDQAVDSSARSQNYFAKGDVAGQIVEKSAPVLTPAAPAPAPMPPPVPESLPGVSQMNSVMEVQQERRRESPSRIELKPEPPKPGPEAEPKPAPMLAAKAAMPDKERTLEGKTFVYWADTWIEKGYANQAKTTVTRGSSQYQELLKQHPEIARYLDLGARVVLKLDNTWYLLAREATQP